MSISPNWWLPTHECYAELFWYTTRISWPFRDPRLPYIGNGYSSHSARAMKQLDPQVCHQQDDAGIVMANCPPLVQFCCKWQVLSIALDLTLIVPHVPMCPIKKSMEMAEKYKLCAALQWDSQPCLFAPLNKIRELCEPLISKTYDVRDIVSCKLDHHLYHLPRKKDDPGDSGSLQVWTFLSSQMCFFASQLDNHPRPGILSVLWCILMPLPRNGSRPHRSLARSHIQTCHLWRGPQRPTSIRESPKTKRSRQRRSGLHSSKWWDALWDP